MADLLVVAGEASGDRIAALVAAELTKVGVRCVGIGGPACRAAGVRTVGDTEAVAAMGLRDVLVRAPTLALATARLAREVRSSPPRAALLVNFTELNQRLGRALRRRGVRVLWCVAPQVWAWRRGRLETLRGAFDRLAVILPFELDLWRDAGHDAVYVGHPSWSPETPRETRGEPTLAVLPGSRSGEIARLAEPLVGAAATLLEAGDVASGRLLLAPGLRPRERAWLEELAARAGLVAALVDPGESASAQLAGVSASLCASGTASLEAALAGAAPVVAYRMDALTFALAKRLVRTPHIALPNILLGRRAYPELLQGEVTRERIVAAARASLAQRHEALASARELRGILAPPSDAPFGRRVAELLLPWLGGSSHFAYSG